MMHFIVEVFITRIQVVNIVCDWYNEYIDV